MNYKKVMLIGQFFIYALINPVSILSLIAGRFIEFPSYFTNFFELLWQPTVLYVWMVLIYALVILLNYFISRLKNYNSGYRRVSFKSYLEIYFKSQKIYWIWGRLMIFPFIILGFYVYTVGQGTAIYLVYFTYPFHYDAFKVLYLVFGITLIIFSYIHYVNLVRKERLCKFNWPRILKKIINQTKLVRQFFWYAFLNPVSILMIIGTSFLKYPSFLANFFFDLSNQIRDFRPTTLYVWIVIVYAFVVLLNYFMFSPKKYKAQGQKLSFKDYLTIYFKSQKVYWIWGAFMVFPIMIVELFTYITEIYIVIEPDKLEEVKAFVRSCLYPYSLLFKASYLIFGCILMILSHRTYVKLAKGEKVNNGD